MKKNFTLPLFAVALSLTPLAGMANETSQRPVSAFKTPLPERTVRHSSTPVKVSKPQKEAGATDILEITPLTLNPQGQTAYYFKDCTGIYPYATEDGIAFYRYTDTNDAAKFVWGDDGNVYIYDILQTEDPYNEDGRTTVGYTKGTMVNENEIVISFPQTVMTYDSFYFEGYIYYNICVLKETEDDEGGIWYEPVTDITSVTLTREPGSDNWVLQIPYNDGDVYGLGYFQQTDEDAVVSLYAWGEYVDFTQSYKPLDAPMAEIPAGVEPEQWQIIDGLNGWETYVAFDGDDIYIKGFSSSYPELTLKATKNGDGTASIPFNQYVGIDPYNVRFMLTRYAYVDPSNDQQIILAPEDTEFVLKVDETNKRITCADPELYLVICTAPSTGLQRMVIGFIDFIIQYQESYAGTPANPMTLFWSWNDEEFDSLGYFSFFFEIPILSTKGTVLDMDYLYYRIYQDGQLLTFNYNDPFPGCYWGTEDTTLIPFLFSNGFDIYAYWQYFNLREIGIYDYPETMGVQTVYEYEGVTTESDLLTLNIATGEVTGDSGVSSVTDASVVSEEYYDLTGRKVLNPDKGIFVKRTVMSDGKVRTTKIAR